MMGYLDKLDISMTDSDAAHKEEISCLDAVIFKLAQDMQLGFLNQPCFVFKFQKVKGQNFCNILRVPKFTDFVS